MEKKVSSSSKFRSLKEFLSSTRSLSHSHHQNYESGLKKQSHTSNFRSSIRNTKNSISLFNLIAASSTTGPPNNENFDRPISMALDDQYGYAYEDREIAPRSLLPTKSVSMYGLSPVDTSPVTESSNLHPSPSTRNLAARLFYNLRSKFRRRRRDRSKIVDSKSTDFGTLFPEEQQTSLPSTSFPRPTGDLNNATPISARYHLKSASSLDTILDASTFMNNGAMINNDLTETSYQVRDEEPLDTGTTTCTSTSSRSNNDCLSQTLKLLAEPAAPDSDEINSHTALSHNSFERASPSSSTQHNEIHDSLLQVAVTQNSQSASPKPVKCLTKELEDLLHYGWYWGGLSKDEAEAKLKDQPDGSFVVRDSSSDHYLLSLSFNSNGKTLHTRIEYRNGQFCFYMSPDSDSFNTVAELIQHCIAYSEVGIFCYSKPRRYNNSTTSYPVRLTKPISRFTEVKSLLYLSRLVIRQYVRFDLISRLPLPASLIEFISEQRYI